MSTLLDALVILLVVFDVFLLPGYGIARRFVKTDDAVELSAISLAIGLLCGSALYFIAAGLLHLWLTKPLVLVMANLINLIHLPVIISDIRSWWGRRSAGVALFSWPDRRTRWVFSLALVVLALYFVRYDKNSFFLHCANYPVSYSTGLAMGDGSVSNNERNDVLGLPMEEREGNPALVAASPALFQFLGYRVFYALEHLVLFLVAFLLGELLARDYRAGIMLGLLFALHPTLLALVEMDQNVHTMVVSIVALYLMMRTVQNPLLSGVFFGLAFGCRHHMLLGLVGPMYYTLTSTRKFRTTALVLLGFSIPSAVWAYHHLLAFGTIFHHESFMHISVPVAHEVLGFGFDLPYIFQWPLVPELLRSPFTGFPQSILLPLTLVRDFGTVPVALSLIGVVWMFFNRRRDAIMLVGFVAPVYLILMIQGNWSENDKLRFVIDMYVPIIICVWRGMLVVARQGRRVLFVGGTVVLALGISLAAMAADDLRFPVDPRAYVIRPNMTRETDSEYAITRREFVSGSPLPKGLFETLFFAGGGWRQAVYEVSNPGYEDQTEPIPEKLGPFLAPDLFRRAFQSTVKWHPAEPFKPLAGDPVNVRLDLSEMPTRLCNPTRVMTDPSSGALDLATNPGPAVLKNRKVPFFDNAVDIVFLRVAMPEEFVLAVMILRVPGFYPDPPVVFPEPYIDVAVNGEANMMLWLAVYTTPTILFTWDVSLVDAGSESMQCVRASKE